MTCVLRRRECEDTKRECHVAQQQMKEHQGLLATTRSEEEERKDSAQSPGGLVLLTPLFLAPRTVREYMFIVKAALCVALSCSSTDTYYGQGP